MQCCSSTLVDLQRNIRNFREKKELTIFDGLWEKSLIFSSLWASVSKEFQDTYFFHLNWKGFLC